MAQQSQEDKILKQVGKLVVNHQLLTAFNIEFYFSDSNFPYDKFLWTAADLNDGWVDISKIASFKRMQEFDKTHSEIAKILQKSEKLLEVDLDGLRVRRKVPLVMPEDEHKKAINRSVYVKGLSVDEKDDTQKVLEEFFAKHTMDGEICCVRMRRDDAKKFKGSVFVEFNSSKASEDFCLKKLEFEGQRLEIMSKKAYVDEKIEKYKNEPKNGPHRRPFNAFREMRKRASKEIGNTKATTNKKRPRTETDVEGNTDAEHSQLDNIPPKKMAVEISEE